MMQKKFRKIDFSMEQEKFIEDIVELESLIRTYIALDRLLFRYKKEPPSIEALNEVREKVLEVARKLYSGIPQAILEGSNGIGRQAPIVSFINPELNQQLFNRAIHYYKWAKINESANVIQVLSNLVTENITEALKLILKYYPRYNIPKATRIVLNKSEGL